MSKRSKILSFIHTHRPIDERQQGANERGRRSGRGEKDWKGDGDKGFRSAVRHTAGVRHRGPGSSALSLETAQMCQAPASERFPSLWPVDPSPAGGPPTNPSTAPSTLFGWHNPREDGEGKRRHKSTCMKAKRAYFSSSTNGIGKMTHHCEALLQIFLSIPNFHTRRHYSIRMCFSFMKEVFIVCVLWMSACAPAALRSACIEIALYHDLHSSAGGLTLREGATDRVKVKKKTLWVEPVLELAFWCIWVDMRQNVPCCCPLSFFYFVAVAS